MVGRMISKATCVLYLCAQLTAINALSVSFSESDSSVTESDLRATAAITISGQRRSEVTCTLIPLSLEQARFQYGYELGESSVDPAESELDFSPAMLQHVFGPGISSVDQELQIAIVNDDIYEADEVFVVRLNVSTSDALDEAELEIVTQYLILRISADFDDEPRLTIVDRERLRRTTLSESNGLLEDFFTIDKGVVSELPLSFSLEVDNYQSAELGSDYQIQLGQFTIYPNQSNVSIDLTIIEDDIAEDIESFSLSLLTDSGSDSVRINIADNDEVRIRIGNKSEVEVNEENSIVELCAEIVSPSEIDREANILGNVIAGTATASVDYIIGGGALAFALNPNSLRACQSFKILDDDVTEPAEFFNVILNHFGDDPLVIIEPDNITFTIVDNDAVSIEVDIPGGGSSLTVEEGESHILNISLPQSILVEVQIMISATSGTATNGEDFEISVSGVSLSSETGTFTLGPGSSSPLQLNLTITDDQFVEYEENWSLVISIIGLPSSSSQVIPVAIIDNDPVTVGFVNETQLIVLEGEQIRLCAAIDNISPSLLQREIVLTATTQSGSALAGSDFMALSWNFTFSSSSPAIACVEVVTIADSLSESSESFLIVIELITDPNPLITISPSSLDITIAPEPMLQVELPPGNSDGSSLTVEEGESHILNISVPQSILVEVQIMISVTSGTATNGEDFEISVSGVSLSSGTGTFTLGPGSSSSLQLNLTITDDQFVEYEENWSLVISIIGLPSSSSQVIPVTIIDNDPVTVGFVNDTQLMVTEGERITLCAKMANKSPSLLQRKITLAGSTQSGSAQEGSDYEANTWNFTFSSSSSAILCVSIVTLNDQTPELAESFSVVVNLATQSEPLISVSPSVIQITIENDDVPKLVAEFVSPPSPGGGGGGGDVAQVKEGDRVSTINIRISSVGVHPFIIEYDVSATPSGGDVSIEEGTFTFLPSEDHDLLTVAVIDDEVAEEEERVTIVITFSGQTAQRLILIIQDNDDVMISAGSGIRTVVEGEMVEVCLSIVSPSVVDRSVVVNARTQPITATVDVDYKSVEEGLSLTTSQNTCLNVQTYNNDRANDPHVFLILLEVRGQTGINLERESVRVTITDDDGITSDPYHVNVRNGTLSGTPLAPVITDIKLEEEEKEGDGDDDSKSYSMILNWEASTDNGLRPILSFTIIVTLTNDSSLMGLPIFNISVDGNTRDHTLGPIDPSGKYTIQICSWNTLGSNCSNTLSYPPVTPEPVGGDRDRSGIPAAVIVSIILLILLVLVCCCLCCLCVCLCLCDPSHWISYHPEKKENKYREEFKSYREENELGSDYDSDFEEDSSQKV